MRESRSRSALKGCLHFLPVGAVIFGYALVFGVLAVQHGLTVAEACFMSLTVVAGASQFMALPMMAEGAGFWALLGATFLINARHLLYGLNIGRIFSRSSTGVLLLVSAGIVDETYGFATLGPGRRFPRPSYFLGTFACGYAMWNLGTLLGALAGSTLLAPGAAGLDFAALAVFTAMVGAAARGGRDWTVVLSSAVLAVTVQALLGGYWHLAVAGTVVPLALCRGEGRGEKQ